MGLWKKSKPAEDPTSIGNLLRAAGAVTVTHIGNALEFQTLHQDVLLGEALVRLGVITREHLEVAITQQKAIRSKKPKDVAALMDLATKHTKEATEALTEVTGKIAAIQRRPRDA